MKLLWLLLLLFVTRMNKVTETKRCDNPFPGSRKLIQGVDLSTVDISGESNWMQTLFEFTCNKGHKMKFAGKQWDEPDQISHWKEVSNEKLDRQTKLIETNSDMNHEASKGITVGGGYGPVAGALGPSYKDMQEKSQNGKNVLVRIEARKLTMEVTLGSLSNLSAEVKAAMCGLPCSYCEKRPYKDFISTYGTHFLSVVSLGGKAVVETVTSRQFMEEKTEEGLEIAANLTFLETVKGGARFSNEDKKKINELKENSDQTGWYKGGEADLQEDGWIKKWQPTVKGKPTIIKATFRPIYSLIADAHIREQMMHAMDRHLTDTYYKKTLNTIQDLRNKDGLEATMSLKRLADSIKGAQNERNPRLKIETIHQKMTNYDRKHHHTLNKKWTMSVKTCSKSFSGTNSRINVNIIGAHKALGKTSETGFFTIPSGKHVTHVSGCEDDPMEQGCKDVFEVNPTNSNIGQMKEIILQNIGGGLGSDWEMCEITVTHGREVKTKSFADGLETDKGEENKILFEWDTTL